MTVPRLLGQSDSCGEGESGKIDPDRLRLRVLLQRVAALIAAESRLLESAERQRRIVEVVRVHPDRSGLDCARDAMCLRHVARPYSGCETVDRRVSFRDRI